MSPSSPEPEKQGITGDYPAVLAGQHFPSLPQQERSRRKRDALLQSALTLFGQHGYEETTIENIAHQAGVAVGGFYQHFASKKQLLLVLMDGLLREANALTSQSGQQSFSSVQEAIALLVRQALQVDWSYAGAYRAWREAAVQDKEIRTLNTQIEQWTARQLENLFRGLLQFPNSRIDVDVASLAWALSLLFLRLAEIPLEDTQTIDALVSTLTHLIYHGLFLDGAKS